MSFFAKKAPGPRASTIEPSSSSHPQRSRSQDGSNNRLYKRLGIGGGMKGILVTIDQPILSSFSVVFKDFSKSGAGLFVREPVGIQRLVRVSIDGADFPPLEGRVVWCGPIKDDERADAKDFLFRVGVDFMPRDDEARENQLAIYTYLRSLFERENAE